MVFAQESQLNPGDDRLSLEVRSLSLEGFSGLDDYPIDISYLKQQMAKSRQRFGKRLTVGQLHQIADELTILVRRQGFSFHTIFLPPQRVIDGQVEFVMQEGVLADVQVLNKTPWPDRRFRRAFKPLIGKLLYAPAVEDKVHALKSQPGIRVFAFYSRGSKAGEARLNLRVEQSNKRAALFKIENYGSEANGENRALIQFSEYQFTGRFDRLSLALLQGIDASSNTYASLSYAIPFGQLNWMMDINLSSNAYDVVGEFEAQGIEGSGDSARLTLTRTSRHKFDQRRQWYFGAYQRASDFGADGEFEFEQLEESRGVFLGWSGQKAMKTRPWLLSGRAEIFQGQFTRPEDNFKDYIDEPFSKAVLDMSAMRASRSKSPLAANLKFRLRSQQANQKLPGVEKSIVAGAYGVRSAKSGLYTGDRSVIFSSEFTWPKFFHFSESQRWNLTPSLFVDWAKAEKFDINDSLSGEAEFSGLGLAMEFSFGKHISGKLSYSKPIEAKIDGSDIDDDDALLLFELRVF